MKENYNHVTCVSIQSAVSILNIDGDFVAPILPFLEL